MKEHDLEPSENNESEPTPEELEILDGPGPESENDFEQKYNDAYDRYQRCLAEFDNFRKRTAKEMSARFDDGVRAACEKFLPVVDNFDRALAAHQDKEDTFYQGVAMVARQFDGTLTELGVTPMDADVGTEFDPNLHNAVAHVEDENFGQNVIIDVLQKGYTHKDKVLRHSMVRVAN